ncbi:MAG: carbohydrate kinase family protein [Planctomycetaceae bacterium]
MHPSPSFVVTLGEILWDMFPTGPRFGGAPANFAHHVASLGVDVAIVSAVGNDELGDAALGKLRESTIHTQHVFVSERFATGRVEVAIDSRGHASYRFNDEEAWDHIPWTPAMEPLASRVDAVCFGTLAQRHDESRQTIRRFLEATPAKALRVLDLNLRSPFYDDDTIQSSLELANILKLNDDELKLVAEKFVGPGDELAQSRKLLDRFDLELVAVTRGSRGGLLVSKEACSEEPAQATTVRDTVGAGDTFTAAVTVGLLKKLPLETINRTACRMAEFVCSQSGATPRLPEELLSLWSATTDR